MQNMRDAIKTLATTVMGFLKEELEKQMVNEMEKKT